MASVQRREVHSATAELEPIELVMVIQRINDCVLVDLWPLLRTATLEIHAWVDGGIRVGRGYKIQERMRHYLNQLPCREVIV